jgi:predicted metal-dependent hydrolase
MSLKRGSVIYGRQKIEFSISYVPRKTLEIAVLPDGSVAIKAPLGTEYREIEKKVLKRSRWIVKQLIYFRQFQPKTPQRRYLGGETHLYLGRRYRLKIHLGRSDAIKLIRGFFLITAKGGTDSAKIKNMLESWYAAHGQAKIREFFEEFWSEFKKNSFPKPVLRFRKMKTRWGSLSKRGTLTINPDLIRAPKGCIEYVFVHELCHLKHADHGTGFYKFLKQKMPDWEKRKHKLELSLI